MATRFPENGALWVPGGLGENRMIDGIDEETVHIGDVVRIGTATCRSPNRAGPA